MFRCKTNIKILVALVAAFACASPIRAEPKDLASNVETVHAKYVKLESEYLRWLSSFSTARAQLPNPHDSFVGLATKIEITANQKTFGIDDKTFRTIRHAQFLAGWSYYYAAVTTPGPTRSKHLTESRKWFTTFLDVRGVATDQWTVELLAANSKPQALAVIGMALSEIADGNDDHAESLFRLLKDSKSAGTDAGSLQSWRVRGAVFAGRNRLTLDSFGDLVELAKETPNIQLDVATCALVARAAYGRTPPDETTGIAALKALASGGQIALVEQYVIQYSIDIEDGPDELQLLVGRQAFYRAHEAANRIQYEQAIARIRPPLDRMRRKGISPLALDCRFLAAFGSYQIGKHQEASADAKRFIDDVQELRDIGGEWKSHRKQAQKAAMLRFKSLRQLAEVVTEADRHSRELLALIQEDVEFWGKELADVAKFQLVKLKSEGATIARKIEELTKIDSTSEFYKHALYELVILRAEARRAATDTEQRAAQLSELAHAAKEYWSNTPRGANPSRDVGVMVQLADAYLTFEPFEKSRVERLLTQADRIAKSQSLATNVTRDYHYVHLKLARKMDDLKRCEQETNWLVENAPGSSLELAALTSLCALLDQRLVDAADETSPAKNFEYYSQLQNAIRAEAKLANTTPLSLRNAEHAWYRFAQLAGQLKKHSAAAEAYQELVTVFPHNKQYLRPAGMQLFINKSYSKSYQAWRALLQLLDEAEDGENWYEAKYYVIACLSKTDPKKAAQVMIQFEALYLPIRFDSYKEKFQTLAKEVKHRAEA
ncbi:MAG: hypothetical protein ACI9HK_003362 [Pirellulaceae bacterium]|jgi:hypothetical protein